MPKSTTPAEVEAEIMAEEVISKEPISKSYELMVIVKGELRESEAKKEMETVTKWVEKNKGEVTVNDFWGKRPLMYKIKAQKESYYAVFNFTLNADRAPAMDKMLRLEKNVLRYLMMVLPKDYIYINYLKQKETEEEKMAKKERKVSEVVVEKPKKAEKEAEKMMAEVVIEKKSAEEPMAKKEAGAEKKAEKTPSVNEPVDKDLDAKLDKILGGDLEI